MTAHTHQTAPTQFVEANGIPLRLSPLRQAGGVLRLNQHYVAPWITGPPPAVTDGLARDREVILFDNAASPAAPRGPDHVRADGRPNAVAFIRALGLKQGGCLGFSIGGMVAQEITLQAPDLVRKADPRGTGPRGGQGMASLTQVARRIFGAAMTHRACVLAAQFSPSEAGQRRDGF